MKTSITFLFCILFIVQIFSKEKSFIPVDTVKKRVVSGLFFEPTSGGFSIYDLEEGIEETSHSVRRAAESLPLDVEGYFIEIKRVYHKPLAPNDEFFMKFGGIMLEKVGEYAFAYVIGNFRTLSGAEEHCKKVISPHYPDAFTVKYKNGVRVFEK